MSIDFVFISSITSLPGGCGKSHPYIKERPPAAEARIDSEPLTARVKLMPFPFARDLRVFPQPPGLSSTRGPMDAGVKWTVASRREAKRLLEHDRSRFSKRLPRRTWPASHSRLPKRLCGAAVPQQSQLWRLHDKKRKQALPSRSTEGPTVSHQLRRSPILRVFSNPWTESGNPVPAARRGRMPAIG